MLILVDNHDNEKGSGEKIEVHRKGELHRAFSIVIFNAEGKMLIQKRAKGKYHSAGRWSNACCGHPRPGENIEKAAHRRLREELGFDCELREIFQFVYKAQLDEGIMEYEYDHIFIGTHNGKMEPDLGEVEDLTWIGMETLTTEIKRTPEKYTPWFEIICMKLAQRNGLFSTAQDHD